mgnify:FL=1
MKASRSSNISVHSFIVRLVPYGVHKGFIMLGEIADNTR